MTLVAGAWMVPALHAQDLTAEQRARLDGRFETVLQMADQGTLAAEIDRLRRTASLADKQARSRTSLRGPGGAVETPLSARGLTTQRASGLPVPLPQDVRPEARRPDGTPVYEAIVHTQGADALSGAGVQVTSAFDKFALVRATPSDLRSLSRLEGVEQVRSARRIEPHNDEAASETGARTLNEGVGGTAYRGQEVMACVIDSGIDWTHPDFTDENGNTRIHSIWDQRDDSTDVPTPVENDDSRFGPNFNPDYGSEYFSSDVENGTVNQKDTDGHGTHVAGTVASSGRAYKQSSGTTKFRGVAPDADIIAVRAGFPASNARVADGINYCKSVAEANGQPVVINMSLGTDFAPHDGTSLLAQVVDIITNNGTASGTAVVASAGNSGSPFNPIHISGNIAAGDSADVALTVPSYDTTAGDLNDFYSTSLWTYEDGPYSISVYTPGAQDTLTVSVDSSGAAVDSLINTPRGAIFVESAPNVVGSARYVQVVGLDLLSTRPPAEGTWRVRLRSEGSQSTSYHGWFLGSSIGAAFEEANNAYTIGSPATSESAIAVGAYVHRQRWTSASGTPFGFPPGAGFTRDHTAYFSSRGPTVDGRQKPAVSAPGAWTPSALSSQAPSPSSILRAGDGEHLFLTGTSMSAPVTAGTVALLLQEDPSLSTNAARNLLTQTARVDDRVEARGGVPNPTFGYGKVDALRALTRLRSGPSNEVPVEILSYEDAFGNAFNSDSVTSEPVGETGPDRFAVRFTPSQSGAVTGAYVSAGLNNDLTDSLYVQVWSDNGSGRPDAPLGNRVAVPAARLTPYTPTFIRLRGTRVAVQADSSYHLVLTPKDNGGTLEVLAETVGSTTGRSSAFDGGSWTGTGNDLAIRAQVGGGLSTQDQTPPSVPGPVTARGFADSVSVEWEASPSSDVATYRVYRDTAPIDSSDGPGTIAVYDSVSAPTTAYTDTSVQLGTQYYYRITAVDDSLNESSFSGQATATPLAPPEVAVSPTSLSETLAGGDSSEQALQVSNEATEGARNLNYRVSVRSPDTHPSATTSGTQQETQRPTTWSRLLDAAAGATTWTPAPAPRSHAASPPTIASDPVGDAQTVDVLRMKAGIEGEHVNVVIENASDVDPSNYVGVLSLDVDQDTSTGVDPISGAPSQELGAEFAAVVNAPEETVVLLDAASEAALTTRPLQVDSSAIHFSLPLAPLGADPPMNVTGVVGTLEEPTDWFPDAGSATMARSWLAVSPRSGSLPPDSTEDLAAGFEATGLKDSTYEATLHVASNDPDDDTVDVPVSLTVNRPAAPTALTASADTTAISLSWTAPGDASVTGYNVYRSTTFFTTPGGATKVNDAPVSNTQFTDTGLAEGTTYYYRVAAADDGGTESVLADPAQATTEGLVVDGQLNESEYIGLGTNVDAADGFSSTNDIDSLLYYPDPDEQALYVAVAGTLEANNFNGYGLLLNVTGANAPTGAPAGDSLGFPSEDMNHHFLTGDGGAHTDFTADFEVDYVLLASPAGSNTTVGEAAAYGSSAQAVTRLGITDQAGTAQSGTGPGGNTVTFAHLNSEAPLTGAEFKVPFSELGGVAGGEVTADQNLQVFAVIVSATGYFSNETIPGDGTQIADGKTDNVGNPGFDAQWDAYAGGPYHTAGDGLPVELATFRGRTDENRVVLQWRTASETNNAAFRIQRKNSAEEGAWQTVGSVKGSGTTTSAQSYRFTDTNLPYEADSLAYRLTQVDTDGTTHVTESITVARSLVTEVRLLNTYPNPARQRATVRYAVPKRQEVTLRLFDVLGRQVQTVVKAERKGRHRRRIDVSGLASGVYFLRLSAGGTVRTQKLTVLR